MSIMGGVMSLVIGQLLAAEASSDANMPFLAGKVLF